MNNEELYRMHKEIDDKFNLDVRDYFSLNEESRNVITQIIVDHFENYFNSSPDAMRLTKQVFRRKIKKAEDREDYIEAEILNRVLNRLIDITLWED